MVLLRKVIGDALRARRLSQHRTLREVSTSANVSLGYLSEIERGHKEASSELLASICAALGAQLSEMLADVASALALAEQIEGLAQSASRQEIITVPATTPGDSAGTHSEVTEGDVTVHVRSKGPLKTTFTAKRTGPGTPGQLRAEPILAA
jgi:XRE family transcriptional regulator, stress-response regulator